MPSWWNGRHKGLKILALRWVPVQVRPRAPQSYLFILVFIKGNLVFMKLLVAYFFLFSGVVLGSTANSLLKLTEGFTKPLLSIFCSVFIILAIYCLSKAMTVIPAGFTYATYGGLTITAVTLFGMFKYNQVPNIYGIIGLLFIIAGVILVNYFGRISS